MPKFIFLRKPTAAEGMKFEELPAQVANLITSGNTHDALRMLEQRIGKEHNLHKSQILKMAQEATEMREQSMINAQSEAEKQLAQEFGQELQLIIDEATGKKKIVTTGKPEWSMEYVRAKGARVKSQDIKREVRDLGGRFGWIGSISHRIERFGRNLYALDEELFGRLINPDELNALAQNVLANVSRKERLQQYLKRVVDRKESVWALAKGSFLRAYRNNELFSGLGGAWNFGTKLWQQRSPLGRDALEIKSLSAQIADLTAQIKLEKAIVTATTEKLKGSSEEATENVQTWFKGHLDDLRASRGSPGFTAVRQRLIEAVKEEDAMRGNKNLETALMKILAEENMNQGLRSGELLTVDETKQRHAAVAQFAQKVMGETTDPFGDSSEAIEQFITIMQRRRPAELNAIIKGKEPQHLKTAMKIAAFLMGGIYGNPPRLAKKRMMPFSAENLADILIRSDHYTGAAGSNKNLDKALARFATEFPRVPAERFSEVFNRVVAGEEPTKAERFRTEDEKITSRNKNIRLILRDVWTEIMPTTSRLAQKDREALQEKLESDTNLKGYYEEMLKDSSVKKIMGIFFGNTKGHAVTWMFPGQEIPATLDNFVTALNRATEFMRATGGNFGVAQNVIAAWRSAPENQGVSMENLDFSTFNRILTEQKAEAEARIKAEEERAKAATMGGQTVIVQAPQAAANDNITRTKSKLPKQPTPKKKQPADKKATQPSKKAEAA
jgi:hypothetical protein